MDSPLHHPQLPAVIILATLGGVGIGTIVAIAIMIYRAIKDEGE